MIVDNQARAAAVRSLMSEINTKMQQIDKILSYMEHGPPGLLKEPEEYITAEDVCED